MKTKNRPDNRGLEAALGNVRRTIACEFAEVREEHPQTLRLVLNEAEAIAEQTDFPHLFFLELAREKAESLTHWSRRQRNIRRQAPSISFAA